MHKCLLNTSLGDQANGAQTLPLGVLGAQWGQFSTVGGQSEGSLSAGGGRGSLHQGKTGLWSCTKERLACGQLPIPQVCDLFIFGFVSLSVKWG